MYSMRPRRINKVEIPRTPPPSRLSILFPRTIGGCCAPLCVLESGSMPWIRFVAIDERKPVVFSRLPAALGKT